MNTEIRIIFCKKNWAKIMWNILFERSFILYFSHY